MPAAIEVNDLVKEFKKGPRAVDGIDLRVEAGRDLRLPRPQRRGQVHHGARAHHAAAAHRGPGARGGLRRGGARARRCARTSAPRCRRPRSTRSSPRREHMRLQTALQGLPARRARAARRRADRARRPGRGRRPQGGRLLRRHEAAPGPGAGAGAQPAHPVPRRAHHRPRPAEPQRAVGRGRAAGLRARA